MKHVIFLAVFITAAAASLSAYAGETEIRACDFKAKAGCVSGDASVTLADGKVSKIEIDVIWCGQPGEPGYTCTIDSSRGDDDSKWSEEGSATLIANASPFSPGQPDRVRVTVGKYVSIDLDEAQSVGRCGAGAELPRAIVIPTTKKKACRVWWSKEP